jgi:hypothetical protein
MTDVNEEIVKAYFEAKGYIVKTNHYFKKNKGASDIDLVIYHPKTKDKAIVSVKGWHNDSFKNDNIQEGKQWGHLNDEKLGLGKQAEESAKSFFGDSEFKRILVFSNIQDENYESFRKKVAERFSFDEVIDFPHIIKELIEDPEIGVKTQRNYKDSEFLQTLRLLKKYYIEPLKKKESVKK